jgi:hypothetical protein
VVTVTTKKKARPQRKSKAAKKETVVVKVRNLKPARKVPMQRLERAARRTARSEDNIAAQIALVFADPENRQLRWGSIYSVSKTALSSPWSRDNYPYTGDAAVFSSFLFVFRDLLRHSITFWGHVTNDTVYLFQWREPSGDSYTLSPTLSLLYDVIPSNQYLHPAYLAYSTGDKFHGDALPVGTATGTNDGARRFFWCNVGDTISLIISNSDMTLTDTYALSVDRWTDAGIRENSQFSDGLFGEVTEREIAEEGYYAINIVWHVSTPTVNPFVISNASLTHYSGDASVWGHQMMPHLMNNLASVNAARVTAVTAKVTNTASPLVRNGNISQFQAPAGSYWYNYASYDVVASAQGAATRTFEKGAYSFLKPTSPDDFNMHTYHTTNASGQLIDTFFPLTPVSGFLVLAWQTTDSSGRAGYTTIRPLIEFETTDTFRNVDVPRYTNAQYEMAIESVKYVPQHFENNTHFGALLSSIRSSVNTLSRGALQAAPYVVKGLRTIKRWTD